MIPKHNSNKTLAKCPECEAEFLTTSDREYWVWTFAGQIAAAHVAGGFLKNTNDVDKHMKKIYKTIGEALTGESVKAARALVAELERSQQKEEK